MMGIVFQIYGIGGIVYELLDAFCFHFFAREHFYRGVHGRLNNVLMGGKLPGRMSLPCYGQRTGLCVHSGLPRSHPLRMWRP